MHSAPHQPTALVPIIRSIRGRFFVLMHILLQLQRSVVRRESSHATRHSLQTVRARFGAAGACKPRYSQPTVCEDESTDMTSSPICQTIRVQAALQE